MPPRAAAYHGLSPALLYEMTLWLGGVKVPRRDWFEHHMADSPASSRGTTHIKGARRPRPGQSFAPSEFQSPHAVLKTAGPASATVHQGPQKFGL